MQALSALLARWSRLPRATRLLGYGVAALVVCTAVVGGLLAHPPRTPLFASSLHSEQLDEVEQRLASWNVPFTPTADNVVVDAGRRNDLLLRLSLAGVPHAHLSSTAEALASIGVLTPEAVVEAQTRSGLAGDIEMGLRGIDGVDDARVIVAPMKTAEFADESTHEASASVRLTLRDGIRLPRPAIDGVRAFVAASVPGLAAARVTILDDRGIALGTDDAVTADSGELQASLQSALDGAFGEGSTIVRVRAEYAPEQVSERDVLRAPFGAAVIDGARRTESYDAAGKRYRQIEEGENRGTQTRERVTSSHAGRLTRLSTAVFVDQRYAADLAKVRELAAATVGFDAKRGDALAVEAVDFRHLTPPRRDLWWLLYGSIVPLLPALVIAIGLVICARLAIPAASAMAQSLLERSSVERTSKAAAGFPPARVHHLLEREPAHAAAAIISALPAATATAVLELYPPHEREAIVRRMQSRPTPLLDDPGELLRHHV